MRDIILQLSVIVFFGILSFALSLFTSLVIDFFKKHSSFEEIVTRAWITLVFVSSVLFTLLFFGI